MLPRASLVQAEHLTRGVVELVMVDLNVRKGCIELYVDVALPGSELECCHGGGGYLVLLWDMVRRSCIYKGTWLFRRQTWESQVSMLVTKQCTWALSGTVGLVVSVLELEAAELVGPRLGPTRGSTRFCRGDALGTRSIHSGSLGIVDKIKENSVFLFIMLIGLCGGKHPVGQNECPLIGSRNLRREVVDSFIPHRGAWLQASPSNPHRCHSRSRKVSG